MNKYCIMKPTDIFKVNNLLHLTLGRSVGRNRSSNKIIDKYSTNVGEKEEWTIICLVF